MIYIRKNGAIVSRSKNLRGIMRYRSRGTFITTPERVHILQTPNGALLRLRWQDGAYAVAHFAALDVARRWVAARMGPRGSWADVGARMTPLWYWHAATRAECEA